MIYIINQPSFKRTLHYLFNIKSHLRNAAARARTQLNL